MDLHNKYTTIYIDKNYICQRERDKGTSIHFIGGSQLNVVSLKDAVLKEINDALQPS
jgi:hypothetical protein